MTGLSSRGALLLAITDFRRSSKSAVLPDFLCLGFEALVFGMLFDDCAMIKSYFLANISSVIKALTFSGLTVVLESILLQKYLKHF